MEGRKQKAREGKWNGGQAPFGYNLDKENDTITIDPTDAEVVRIIFQKYVHEDMGLDSSDEKFGLASQKAFFEKDGKKN